MKTPTINSLIPYFPTVRFSVVKNFLLIAQAILTAKSTNLSVAEDRIGALRQVNDRQPCSHYKRLIRFFNYVHPDNLSLCIMQCTFAMLSGRVRYLVLDATTWQVGQKNIQLLVLSFLYQEVAIPIFWQDLNKKGHSSEKERQAFIEKAAQLFNLKGKVLLADREYTGQRWFTFLHQQGIDFVIRLQRECYKHNTVTSYRGLERKALRRKRTVWTWLNWPACRLKLVMCRNREPGHNSRKKDEPVFYWLTSLDNVHTAAELYKKRWRIEQCFKALKSNGFNLEAMSFKKTGKIELLMAVVVFVYVLSIYEGVNHKKRITTKRYADQSTAPAQSLFKKGLGVLNAILIVFEQFLIYLQTVFEDVGKRRFSFVQ